MEKFTQAPVGLDIDQTVSDHADDISNLADGMGIVANGNAHVAVANGQAVFVRNHSSLADGLYWAKAAIAANAALSTSNLTPDDSGGLNKLKTEIDALNSNFTYDSKVIQPLTGRFTARDAFRARRRGNIISFASYINTTSEIPAGEEFAYIGWDDPYGVVAITKLDGTASYPTYVNGGKFGPERAIPAGWYVIIGAIVG